MKPSIYDTLLSRLATKLTARIVDELTAVLIGELNKHLKKSLLPALDQKVKQLSVKYVREAADENFAESLLSALDQKMKQMAGEAAEETFSKSLLPALDEKIKQMTVEHGRAAAEGFLVSKMASAALMRENLFLPNEIVCGSESGEYLRASNPLARDFFSPEFKTFCERCLHVPPLQLMHRKIWEYAFVYHRLNSAGVLEPGRRGLGFGVGAEKLPAVFASMGAEVTATDAPIDTDGWRHTGQYSGSLEDFYYPDLIDRESFKKLVHYEDCDMNNISPKLKDYDFCWSSCAFEHLGSLQNGIDFFINSVEKTLKIGGVACHTTELNLTSDTDTLESAGCVLYRKRDLAQLSAALEERGHWVEPLRIEPGNLPPDYLVDIPPYANNPHLKVLLAPYVTTSVGIVARRGR